MGSKQPHCDALSRLCESPCACTCSEVDTTEPLKCGPCRKCRRLAECMELVWPGKFPDKFGCTVNRETFIRTCPKISPLSGQLPRFKPAPLLKRHLKHRTRLGFVCTHLSKWQKCSYRTEVSASFTLLLGHMGYSLHKGERAV
ncbi:hypothetical protein DPMN_039863 [Dreissena polymorpha]|uniref:Uncharacterized protein n=1 Tax=Dreissena polymorpha TaxID=45954 RepID=A0A9D4HWB3_DREPO|nr:hypothetical protein DPMN_039863 [Dreissena polymorpha]